MQHATQDDAQVLLGILCFRNSHLPQGGTFALQAKALAFLDPYPRKLCAPGALSSHAVARLQWEGPAEQSCLLQERWGSHRFPFIGFARVPGGNKPKHLDFGACCQSGSDSHPSCGPGAVW